MDSLPKPDQQVIVDFIISRIREAVKPDKIRREIKRKWETSDAVFNKYYRTAKQQYSVHQAYIKKELLAFELKLQKKQIRHNVLTATERKVILSQIARGEIEVPMQELRWNSKTKKFDTFTIVGLPTHSTRISAIQELNKMEGDYAPVKLRVSNPDGNQQPLIENTVTVLYLPNNNRDIQKQEKEPIEGSELTLLNPNGLNGDH